MKTIFLFLFSLVACQFVYSQAPKYRVTSVPVEHNGELLSLAWAGGMDSPQFSPLDIDGDGNTDLFVFDRASNKALVFLSNGGVGDTAYRYAPEYESLFPHDLDAYALLRDYNADGVPDLFTHVPLGTKVYKGRRDTNEVLHFDLVSKLLTYRDGPFRTNIWTSITDIPVFTDVNGDGDMDVLSYSLFGTSVEFYENQEKEHPGDINYSADSFYYERVTSCWGNFTQNSLSNSITLHDSTCLGFMPGPTGGGGSRHTGNSIYHFDADNDNDEDLLNGNTGYTNLVFMHNCGNAQEAEMCGYDSLFPPCTTPVNIHGYPAAFGFDGNNDQLEDLLVAPNSFAAQGDNVNNVWYYRNTGDTLCPFSFEGDSFLVRLQLDFGTDSKPAFCDLNGDGLKDILVGNSNYYTAAGIGRSAFAYLENTGTPTYPRYRLVTQDYDSFSRYNLQGMHPAFGDLDGDGMDDLLVGELNGYVHFFKNTGLGSASYPSLTQAQYFGMKVSNYSAPYIYDVNGDSLPDVLIGSVNGLVSYYWNFGTLSNPMFHPDSVNPVFGNIDVVPYGYVFGYAQPSVLKDSTGRDILMVGSSNGEVHAYEIDSSALRTGDFNPVSFNYLRASVGANAVLTTADINNDGHLEYICGNRLGGLFMFSDSMWDSTAVFISIEPVQRSGQLNIYPNPASGYFMCTIPNGSFVHPQVEVYNMLGEKVRVQVNTNADRITVNMDNVSNGFYFIRIGDGQHTYNGKILLQR